MAHSEKVSEYDFQTSCHSKLPRGLSPKSKLPEGGSSPVEDIVPFMTYTPVIPFSCLVKLSEDLQFVLSVFDEKLLRDLYLSSPNSHFNEQYSASNRSDNHTCSELRSQHRTSVPLLPFSEDPVPSASTEKSNWVQLAGHPGSLLPTGTGSVLKTYSDSEAACLRALQMDVLSQFAPMYEGTQMLNEKLYVRMQDLLYNLSFPSVMDCKMGQRTYLEEEVVGNDHSSPTLRPDMYKKMVAVDPLAPTADEHRLQAVTKLRYMRWRETLSTTAVLGFRVEAVKKSNLPASRDFKLISTWDQAKTVFTDFVHFDPVICENYIQKLKSLRSTLEISNFFATHEFIGSSLLFAHDDRRQANVWMIDFGKTCHVHNRRLDHRNPWVLGNHEDGYLFGMDNLINLFSQIHHELCE